MRPAALCLAAVVITSACATARVPTGDHVRVKYGRIAVAADRPEAVQGGFTQPMTSQREAMKAASSTFGRNYGEGFGRALVYDPRVILLLPLMPVVGLVGVTTSAIYGAVAAESPEAVAAGATALRRALDELDASGRLRDGVIAQLARRHGYHDAVAHDPATGDPPEKVTTLIRVSVMAVELAGAGVNPSLALRIAGSVSVFERGADSTWRLRYPPGVVRGLSSSSEGPKFLRWAEDDAHVFRQKVADELHDLAAKITTRLMEESRR